MDFTLSSEQEDLRQRVAKFVADEIMPVEADPASFEAHENIAEEPLQRLREKARSAGLWAPQMPVARGGLGLSNVGMAIFYEEAGRSRFGPVCMNCAAPDDGNMILLERCATEEQKDRWLQPIIDGTLRSSIVMTEPAPGAGSDPTSMLTTATPKGNDTWVIEGHKWFITGAEGAEHFIVLARTSDDPRRNLTTFMFHRDDPGWEILRRIEIMGPEEHGGHCELRFNGLEIPDANRLMGVGEGMKAVQIRLGTARLTHCMRWLGMAKRAIEECLGYVRTRENFGITLAEHEGVQWMLADAAMDIEIGRLMTMRAAAKLDTGDQARTEVSMAKIFVSELLHKTIATAIQLNGARGYSKDLPLEWMYRYAPQAKLVDGASEVHKMVIARNLLADGMDFWSWD
ncbi:MAG: acyl-CoA dehydrogenase [Alphaproteobacteria bacterium]|jgi:acyl-CoA dehydrogenase